MTQALLALLLLFGWTPDETDAGNQWDPDG